MLTIVYVTCRLDNKVDWFYQSLSRQLDLYEEIKVVIVDKFCPVDMATLYVPELGQWPLVSAIKVRPKPNVWQGKHRLTKEDWFAMATVRNTGLCHAEDGYVVFVDDLSVLMPGWMDSVRKAMEGNYSVAGAYRKDFDMVVRDGLLMSSRPASLDVRYKQQSDDIDNCDGGWLFGCSCGFPVSVLEHVNGWPEFCDSLGAEDVCMGKIIVKAGFPLKYDKRMMTVESEEHHLAYGKLRRTDKGVSPNDKSHKAIFMAENTSWSPNVFMIKNERSEILNGGTFKVPEGPVSDWFDGQLISEML